MKLIKLECPYCGGNFQVDENAETAYCSFCGNQVAIVDDVERSEQTIHIKDEAKIREADLNEKRYRDAAEQRRRYEEEQKAETYRKGKGGKLVLVLLILCAIGAYAGFSTGHPAAGAIAVIQIVLLAISWLISTNYIRQFKGRRLPAFVFTLLACLLIFPYCTMQTKPIYRTMNWPSSGMGALLPKPASDYGEIIADSSMQFTANVHKTTASEFRDYTAGIDARGFTEETGVGSDYEAFDAEGHVVHILYDSSNETMHITMDAPEQYETLNWPLSELSSDLPKPPSDRGIVNQNRDDYLSVTAADMSREQIASYLDEVMESPYHLNYTRSGTDFKAENEEGTVLTIRYGGYHTMELTLKKKEEAQEPTETPAETAQPKEITETAQPEESVEPAERETPETVEPGQSAPAEQASGIRPEFQKMMDDYEAFYDQYIAFMKTYQNSDDTLSMMSDYLALMNKMNEWDQSMESIDESTLSPEEYHLYNEVNLRVAQKLNDLAYGMN